MILAPEYALLTVFLVQRKALGSGGTQLDSIMSKRSKTPAQETSRATTGDPVQHSLMKKDDGQRPLGPLLLSVRMLLACYCSYFYDCGRSDLLCQKQNKRGSI